jgi:hypothetical protein
MTQQIAELYKVIRDHFNVWPSEPAASWVLTNDYEWSPRQIAFLRYGSLPCNMEDMNQQENDVYRDLTLAKRQLVSPLTRDQFNAEVSTERIFFYFRLLEPQYGYRATAIKKTSTIRALCGDEFFIELAGFMGMTGHELLELSSEVTA